MEAIEKSEKPDIQLKAFVQFNKTDALQVCLMDVSILLVDSLTFIVFARGLKFKIHFQ